MYDEDDEYQLGDRLQWESGYHEDMFYLTVRISPDFMDGHIQIISNTTYGYENDPESGIAIDPSVVNYVLEADVNQDGTISVSDVTNILCIITEGSGRSNGYREDGPIYALGDINHDGSIDITDAEELCDYLVFGEWYIGYELNQATYAAHYSTVWNNPSYINFFIDPLIITEKDFGQDIVVPVKATFESIISSWDVEFSFPEGLTPVAFTQGKDMSHEYYDEDGCINTITDNWLAHNTALTHFVVHSPFCDHYIMDENDYWWYSQVIKWEPGTYDEMFLLTLHVDESFVEGPIVINSKASFGYDPRDGSLYPTTVVYNEYDVYPGDANHDGSVTVADITYFLNYIAGAQDDAYGLSDAHPDNVIDILDVEKTFDYIIYGEWYEGYVLNQSEGTEILAKFIEQGDANGDGQTTIGDVVTIIDYLLDGNGEILSTADVNGDGFVTIGDVTALIDMLLSSN